MVPPYVDAARARWDWLENDETSPARRRLWRTWQEDRDRA
jgi:hypothetical protein